MGNVRQLTKKAAVPKRFQAQEFFRNYYGITIGGDATPSTIEVKVAKGQVKYIESLPLHPSQQKIRETPEYNVYRFHLVPTFDFKQEILSHGPDYEVLCPDWFRDEVKADVAQMYMNYGL